MNELNLRISENQKELIDWLNSLYGIIWGVYWSYYLTTIVQGSLPINFLMRVNEFELINSKIDFSFIFTVYCILCLSLFTYLFVLWSWSLPNYLPKENTSVVILGDPILLVLVILSISTIGFIGFLFDNLKEPFGLGIIATIVWMLLILTSTNLTYRLHHVTK